MLGRVPYESAQVLLVKENTEIVEGNGKINTLLSRCSDYFFFLAAQH